MGSEAKVLTWAWTVSCLLPAALGTAQTPEPIAWQWASVKAAAEDVQDAASHALSEARQRAVRGDPADEAARADLELLLIAAAQFNHQLAEFHDEPRQTDREYRELVAVYERARQSVARARFDEHVRADYGRVGTQLSRLGGLYAQLWQWQEVKTLAGAVEEAVVHVYQVTEPRANDPAERRTVFVLRRLVDAARHLNRQLDDFRQGPRETVDDFRVLTLDYESSVRAMSQARFDEHVRGDFDRVSGLLNQLEQAYGGAKTSNSLAEMAHEIVRATAELHEAVRSRVYLSSQDIPGLLQEVANLVGAARHFAAQIDRFSRDPEPARLCFQNLTVAYQNANERLTASGFEPHVRPSLSRAGEWLHKVSAVYEAIQVRDSAARP